mgnify:CR=1 FL=1
MDQGYIKLYRTLLDSEAFAHEGLLKVWIWCLLKASYKQRHVPVAIGPGQGTVELEPGQFPFGRHTAAEELNMASSTVRNRMEKLQKMGKLDIQPDSHYSVVTVCNWEVYQQTGDPNGQASGQAQDNQRTGKGHKQEQSKDEKEHNPMPFEKIMKTWNRFAEQNDVAQIRKLTDKRKRKVRLRWKEWTSDDSIDDAFQHYRRTLHRATQQPFLMGDNDRGWQMDFDWLFRNEEHGIRIWEGKYGGSQSGKRNPKALEEMGDPFTEGDFT